MVLDNIATGVYALDIEDAQEAAVHGAVGYAAGTIATSIFENAGLSASFAPAGYIGQALYGTERNASTPSLFAGTAALSSIAYAAFTKGQEANTGTSPGAATKAARMVVSHIVTSQLAFVGLAGLQAYKTQIIGQPSKTGLFFTLTAVAAAYAGHGLHETIMGGSLDGVDWMGY